MVKWLYHRKNLLAGNCWTLVLTFAKKIKFVLSQICIQQTMFHSKCEGGNRFFDCTFPSNLFNQTSATCSILTNTNPLDDLIPLHLTMLELYSIWVGWSIFPEEGRTLTAGVSWLLQTEWRSPKVVLDRAALILLGYSQIRMTQTDTQIKCTLIPGWREYGQLLTAVSLQQSSGRILLAKEMGKARITLPILWKLVKAIGHWLFQCLVDLESPRGAAFLATGVQHVILTAKFGTATRNARSTINGVTV